MTGAVAAVVSGIPRRSETFVLQELLALEAAGRLGPVFATRPGEADGAQPGFEILAPRVVRLPAGGPAAQADAVVARLRREGVSGVHAFFAHWPADVADLAAARLGLPFGFSAHARDLRKVGGEALAHRAARARVVIACNDDAAGTLRRAGREARVVPHGVDLRRFCARPPRPGRVLQLLAVGRLVPKKGFDVLLEALALAGPGIELGIVGAGPEERRLRRLVAARGLAGRARLEGPLDHRDLPARYAAADAVVVPSVVDAGGDRDGLPNVVLEAMATSRPVVGSRVAAIPSAVVPGRSGWLVPPGDARGLAALLGALRERPEEIAALGRGARRRVEACFSLDHCTARLLHTLEEAYA